MVPFVYFLSWKSCHSLGQAMSETAAWCFGYLATVGAVLAFGIWHISLVSLAPDSPGSAVALVGGFAGMGVSRWVWKRRGGHLKRRAPIPWVRLIGRSVTAMAGKPARPDAPAATPGTTRPGAGIPGAVAGPILSASNVQSALSSKWVRGSVRAVGAMRASRSRPATTATTTSPAVPSAEPAATPAPKPMVTSADIQKAMSNKWVRGSMRAIGAMLEDPKANKPPRG